MYQLLYRDKGADNRLVSKRVVLYSLCEALRAQRILRDGGAWAGIVHYGMLLPVILTPAENYILMGHDGKQFCAGCGSYQRPLWKLVSNEKIVQRAIARQEFKDSNFSLTGGANNAAQ